MSVTRGRLAATTAAPADGETVTEIAAVGSVIVEHILSGRLAAPVDYDQPHDEWVVLLEGAATLDVGGERLELGPGDWVLLPAHCSHRLEATRPGSSWLALQARPAT